MTPTRHNPKYLKSCSYKEQMLKGDIPMGKIFTIALAFVLLTASWVCAGNLEVLADAGIVRAPTPLHIKPGTLVKAEFKSSLKTTSDADLDADSLFPEKVSARNEPKVSPRPAVAYRERSTGTMAPPPRTMKGTTPNVGAVAESLDQAVEMEEELEKDLVLSPPPAKVDESGKTFRRPAGSSSTAVEETGPAQESVREKERPSLNAVSEKKRSTPRVKRKTSSDYRTRSASQRPIRKVRPLTQSNNPWAFPAGSYGQARRQAVPQERYTQNRGYQEMEPPYMTSQPRQRIARPPSAERFVQDGVTVRLAPAAAPACQPYGPEDGYEDDILSTASEIIGLPFAFISSFF